MIPIPINKGYLYAVITVALAASHGMVAYWQYGQGVDSCAAATARDERVARVAYDKGQEGAAAAIAKLEIKKVTIKQRVERETREVPVYRDCRHSPVGVLGVNQALSGKPVSPGNSELP